MIDQIDEALVSEWQLRLLTMNYARSFAAAVERASDEISSQSEDPDIRRAALLWKTNAIAASQSAVFKEDPVVVVVDMWALTEQMVRFLDSGAGSELFGDSQHLAIEAALALEVRITELAASVSAVEGAPEMEEIVETWATEHPIDLSFTREYPRSVIERLQGGGRQGALAAVESLEETVAISTQLLPVFLEVLPKQASWQAELVIEDYFSRGEIEEAAEDLDEISTSLRQVHLEIDELPLLINEQRDAVFAELRREIEDLRTFIDQQRIAALDEILDGIDEQRLETIHALSEERQIVLDAIHEQRVATMEELPDLVTASMMRVDPPLRVLVDYIFWRALLFGAIMGSVGFLGAWFLIRQHKGPGPTPRSTG